MEITERDVRRVFLIVLVAALAILTFLLIRPVMLSIIGGLILAYVFFPVYSRILRLVRYDNLAAAIMTLIIILLILLPIWFLTPIMAQQVFQIFQLADTLDIHALVSRLFPNTAEQLLNQISITADNALGKVVSAILNSLVDFLVNFAEVFLHVVLVGFVFFFALRDNVKLREFTSELSPLNRTQEKKLVQQFKDITSSIINGQVVAGVIQGLLAGLGFFLFGVPNIILLTVVSIFAGIVPLLGLGFIYIPVAIYLIIQGKVGVALIFLAYNILIVSTIDNLIRIFFVSRKARISQVIVLIGMVGGLFLFGVLGLILGPLILVYFLTFLKAYKEKTLSSLFAHEHPDEIG